MPRLLSALVACLLVLPLSAWSPAGRATEARVDLVEGGRKADGTVLAGVRIRLADGFKTYWRHPGDSGIPPTFDFSRSRNVGAVEIEWPAPAIHRDGYGRIVGYAGEVVFPVLVTPADASRPVELELDLAYGVCADICIPKRAGAALTEGGEPDPAVAYWRARVPEAMDAGDPRGLASVELIEGGDGDRDVLRLGVTAPGGAAPQVIVEGPDAWRLPLPEPDGAPGDGVQAFVVPVPGDREAAELRVTAVAPGFSFEQPVWLDEPAATR